MSHFKLTRPAGEAKLFSPGYNYLEFDPIKLIPSNESDYDIILLNSK